MKAQEDGRMGGWKEGRKVDGGRVGRWMGGWKEGWMGGRVGFDRKASWLSSGSCKIAFDELSVINEDQMD